MDTNLFDTENHDIIFSALTGSHNYNLDDENSDKDYKVFVLPTFDDLYYNRMFSKNYNSDEVDYTIHDIRKLPLFLFKSNINFLETLFSKEICINPLFTDFMNPILKNKEKYAKMNLSYLYKACEGMSYEKMSRLHKYTENTNFLKERDGYNTKEACHAVRVLLTCCNYAGGETFEESLRFTHFMYTLAELKSIRKGKIKEENFMRYYDQVLSNFHSTRGFFVNREPDIDLYNKLNESVYNLCKIMICE